jgi:CheY-like chemotaxis protein
VVDDEPIVQQYLNGVLTGEGHKVEIIDNGDEAMEKLGSEDYDVILLDIKLPGMNGIDIYRQLKKKDKSKAGKVIFITGDVMAKDTMAFLSRTKAPYIAKPFDAEQLKREIAGITNP